MTLPHSDLRQSVYQANIDLVTHGLVINTWGNASCLDRKTNTVIIKPSGVHYHQLSPDTMVLVNLDTGKPITPSLKPSSDLPTHLELYKAFPEINAIIHTHSIYAVSFAQAGIPIACLGTTHADHFLSAIPITSPLDNQTIHQDYEKNTGLHIIQTLKDSPISPLECPGILVHSHGPFVWGKSIADALSNAISIEAIAKMAYLTYQLKPNTAPLDTVLHQKHFFRKHGPAAYYGQ